MKKRLAAAVILVLISLTVSGCYPTGEEEPDNFSVEVFEETHFEYSKPNLTVSFDLPEIPENIPSKIKLRKKFYDFWEVSGLFFDGETIGPEQVHEIPERNFISYTLPNTTSLRTYFNRLKFFDREMQREDEIEGAVNYCEVLNRCRDCDREICCITDEELPGFPLQGALDRANELISVLGITDLGEPEIYSISLKTYEKLKQFGWESMFNENYPLTEDDEVYVFEFPKIFGGIEVGYYDMKDPDLDLNTNIIDPKICVGVAKDRIFSFTEQAYEPGYEIISGEPIQFGLDYAISKLRDYLDKTPYGVSKIATINKAKLVYFPVGYNEKGTLEFVPVWSFEGFYEDQRGGAYSPDEYPFYGVYKIVIRTDNGDLSEWKRL